MTVSNTNTDDPKVKALLSQCEIKLSKLSTTDIEFLSGPRLLPSLNNNVPISDERSGNSTVLISAPRESDDSEEVVGLASEIITPDSPITHVSAPHKSGEVARHDTDGSTNTPATGTTRENEIDTPNRVDQSTDTDDKVLGQTTTTNEIDTLVSAPQIDEFHGEVARQSALVSPQKAPIDATVSAPQAKDYLENEEVAGQLNYQLPTDPTTRPASCTSW